MARLCSFCGQEFGPKGGPTERTAEHAIAQWVSKHFPNPGAGVTHTVRAGTHGPVQREWASGSKDVATLIASSVCRACNGGWMNGLEHAVRPYLPPMMRGERRTLYRESATALAAWAVKTALALDLVEHADPPIEAKHYRAMAAAKTAPPEHVQVFAGEYRGWRHGLYSPRSLNMTGDTSGITALGYVGTFTVARAAFQVFFHGLGEELTVSRQGAMARTMPQLWPRLGDFRWPPPNPITEPILERVSDPFPFTPDG
jgi:hypothetical protein